jgi:hypothetical protein
VSLEHFFGHVAGESHRNDDGTDRQTIISRCRVGELLVLEHEPDNPHDIDAIRVLNQNGEQIGYLEREFAGEVVSRSAKGRVYRAAVAGIGRPRRSAFYGVALLIIVDDGSATDPEAEAYARDILSRDRPVLSAATATRPHGPAVDWLVVGTMIVSGVVAAAIIVAFR